MALLWFLGDVIFVLNICARLVLYLLFFSYSWHCRRSVQLRARLHRSGTSTTVCRQRSSVNKRRLVSFTRSSLASAHSTQTCRIVDEFGAPIVQTNYTFADSITALDAKIGTASSITFAFIVQCSALYVLHILLARTNVAQAPRLRSSDTTQIAFGFSTWTNLHDLSKKSMWTHLWLPLGSRRNLYMCL